MDTVKRFPVCLRKPVTQEFMARWIVENKGRNHPAEQYFQEALYESIAGMVFQLAKKFAITCKDEKADLAHTCYARVLEKLHTFDPEKRFTTWVWYVCNSTLSHQYRRDKKNRAALIDDTAKIADEGRAKVLSPVDSRYDRRDVPLRFDIIETIEGLFSRYPNQRLLLSRLFGGTPEDGFEFPQKVCVSAIAKDIGMDYAEAYSFYRRKVRPVFLERFGESGESDE